MKRTRRILALVCSLAMLLTLVLPVQAGEELFNCREGDPLAQEPDSAQLIATDDIPEQQQPSKEEIAAKWATVTSASTLFAAEPYVAAPYVAGELTEEFLETGLTFLNYVRFVAGLPEVTLDTTLNEDAQHGAVLLAAVDYLSHTPGQPADMDAAFYKRGYAATTSSNISACWGYAPRNCLKIAVDGCMNDNDSLGNLTTVGHRRWLLNPTLGKVGFGYAESDTSWSYIVTKVFDRTGTGCEYDFISWPVAGNHPTNLFHSQNPWSVTLNTGVFKTVSADTVKITVTRESDGTTWSFDGSTGEPNIDDSDYYNPYIASYLTVNNQRYGLPNCIIFHPGTDNVDSYEGVYQVTITGIYYTDGTAAELNYEVDFFDINSATCIHSYTAAVTEPTCQEGGYTTYTCSKCGDSYVADYTDPVDHSYDKGKCRWCGLAEKVYTITWKQIYASLGGNIAAVFQAELSQDLIEDPNAFMRFTYAGKTVDVPVSEAGRSGKYYNFYCRIAAINMTDEITAQMMVGSEPVGKRVTTSLESYCSYIIRTSKDEKSVNLMKAMLNYGAAAQKLLDYNTDAMANAGLSPEDRVFTAVDAQRYAYSITGSQDGIKPTEAMLVLGSETTIRISFKLTGGKTVADYTFTVDGVEVEPVYKGGVYRLEVPNIAADRLDDFHTFTLGGITITYCGLSYTDQVMDRYTSGNSFDMAVALYNYSQATEAYVG